MPILYSFRRCPYAMRARLALRSGGQWVELREIALKDKPAELLSASPKGTVPVLVLGDRVIEQSLDIMLWALSQNDPLGWLPQSTAALQEVMCCIADNDGAFKHHLDRYKYPHRFGLADGTENRSAGAALLQNLEARLRIAPFLAGESWGLHDAAVAPFVRQFAHTDIAWFAAQDWPELVQWLQAFESSVAYDAIMQKVAPWNPGDLPLITRFAHTPLAGSAALPGQRL
jgi:glutathione S-transferase